jgi:DNA gyrase subunit A
MGRATGGVIGMRFRGDDALLSMDVVTPGTVVVTVTDGGFAKRTSVDEWAAKGRGIKGVRAMKLPEERGELVGAMVCAETDQIFAIASNGVVIRTKVDEIRASGRDTMGVRMMRLGEDVSVVAVAKGAEDEEETTEGEEVASTEVAEEVEGQASE